MPANSAAEAHLQGATAKPTDPTQPPAADPSKPLMTPVSPPAGDDKKPSSGNATDKVSRSECDQAVGHAFDLAIPANDPRLAGLPPEVMQQLKAQAIAQAAQQNPSENPCAGKGISRGEYDCEMAATTLDEYKKCAPKDGKPVPKKKK